jgi:hypothetical protein
MASQVVPLFSESSLETLARCLEGAATHRQLGPILQEAGIEENGGTPKWERILLALEKCQRSDGQANRIMRFVQVILGPVRFLNNRDGLESYRSSGGSATSRQSPSGAAQATNARRGVAFLQS